MHDLNMHHGIMACGLFQRICISKLACPLATWNIVYNSLCLEVSYTRFNWTGLNI